jgi:hypothetical protein
MSVGVGVGVAQVGDLDDKRCTDEPTAKWTITLPKHVARGNAVRAETAILAKLIILAEATLPVEMTALEETLLEKMTRKRATIEGSQALSDPSVFTINE